MGKTNYKSLRARSVYGRSFDHSRKAVSLDLPNPKPKIRTEDQYLNSLDMAPYEREYYENKHQYYERPAGGYSFGMEGVTEDYITHTMEWHRLNLEREAKIELLTVTLRTVINKLTTKQQAILTLHLQDLTQQQIARQLGISQTNVQKTLYGNWDPVYEKYFGGIIPKLRKLITKELESQNIDIIELLNKGLGPL